MFRRLTFGVITALVVVTISSVAYGEAIRPQGKDLLKAVVEPSGSSQPVVQTNSLVAASFSKNTAFAPANSKGSLVLRATSGKLGATTGGGSGGTKPGVSTVPEPFSLILLGTGLAGLAATLRKRRH